VSITDELLENTAGHAWALTHGALLLPPAKRVAVLACMDACLNVHRILGLEEPDAGVIRTAAGVVSDDAIGSPLASQRLLGIGEIVLIHHTDYGMLTFGDDEVKAAVGAETGLTTPFALEAFADLTGTSAGRWRRLRRAHWRRTRTPSAASSARLPWRLAEVLDAKAGHLGGDRPQSTERPGNRLAPGDPAQGGAP
jgi:carbonic anhydrase